MERIELIEYLYSKGLTETEIEDLLKDTLSKIKNNKFDTVMSDFFKSVSSTILNRFAYLDFNLSVPHELVEKDLFTPIEKWHDSCKFFERISDINIAEKSELSMKAPEVKEYSSRSLPDMVKIINKLGLSDSFDLGLNGYDYFIEGTHDKWNFFASKREILFYSDNENWILLKKDKCFFSKNSECYKITKNYLMGGSSVSQLRMYQDYLNPCEAEQLNNLHEQDYIRAYDTANIIASYLFNYSSFIDNNNHPLNRVSVSKKIKDIEVYGVIIDQNTKNHQVFIKPKCLCDDSEVYISSLGYIDNQLSYIGIGILFDTFDSVEKAYSFEQKSKYALEHQINNFSKFCVFKEYIVTKDKNIPTKFGSYSPEHIPFGISVRPFRNQDKDYIESLFSDELNLVIKTNQKKSIDDRCINLVSESDFSKLIKYT